MTSRERTLCALNHAVPDRVPTALWGSYYTLNDGTYMSLLNHLGMKNSMRPFRRHMSRNSNYYDDRVLDVLNTDIRYIWSGFTDIGGAPMDGNRTDCWGVVWERRGHSLTSCGFPLAAANEVSQIEEYSWPNAERLIDVDMIVQRLAYLDATYPDHAIAARAVNSYGPFEQASELRGREQFYMDLIAEPEIASALLRKCSDVIIEAQNIYFDIVASKIDFVEIPGDDYGGTQDLILSPSMFDEFVKPELGRIVNSAKDASGNLPVAFHSDGAITGIIAQLSEIGIDILNPLEPLPATDWCAIKEQYGATMCFLGGIDVRDAVRGSESDICADVQRCVDTFANAGGYILAPANHLQNDTPPENIVTLYKAAMDIGTYA